MKMLKMEEIINKKKINIFVSIWDKYAVNIELIVAGSC